jgi:uncharacterized membrane protein
MKSLKTLFGIGNSLLFVLLGIYLATYSNSVIGKIIGIACIAFFGGLLLFGIFKIATRQKK